MNQTEFMQAFFADTLAAFAIAGLADAVTFHPKSGAPPVECIAMIDRDVRDVGDDTAPLGYPRVLVTLPRSDVPAAAAGDTVSLPATGESWLLEQRIGQDEVMSQWVVRDA